MAGVLNVLYKDMKDDVLENAKQTILRIFEEFKEERVICNKIKQDFDKTYGESWNCVVGKNFGSHVIHQTEGYIFCSYNEEISILLWKSG